MEAGIAKSQMTVADIIALADEYEAAQPRKKPGRKPKAAPEN